jgi:hypothetical protein
MEKYYVILIFRVQKYFGYNVAIFSNLNQGYLHQMLTKLHDSKTYSTQFFMYFKPMITIFLQRNYLTMLKFGLMWMIGQKQANLGTLVIQFLHVESSKLHDSKCYSTQFFNL